MRGISKGALAAGGAGAFGVSWTTAMLSGASRTPRHVASISAVPSSASTRPARRWTLAPARTTRVATVSGATGTGRRKSNVRRATKAAGPTSRANARASSAAGGPQCWWRALQGPRVEADGTNRSPSPTKNGGSAVTGPSPAEPGRPRGAPSGSVGARSRFVARDEPVGVPVHEPPLPRLQPEDVRHPVRPLDRRVGPGDPRRDPLDVGRHDQD